MADPPGALQELMIITGFSGAGKSTAMNVFEDAGYFCVDNLPPEMIKSLIELFVHEGSKVERAAVVSDVRGGAYFDALQAVLDELERMGLSHRLLFLDAEEETLLNRYKETRRRHPLASGGSIAAGIAAERAQLDGLRARADVVIDTTGLSAATLRAKIVEAFLAQQAATRLAITFFSFGFKHGPPRDADLLFDVRFLPNPNYIPKFKNLTGRNPGVAKFIRSFPQTTEFIKRITDLLVYLLPHYIREGKSYLTIAFGCTGGHHRSVMIASEIRKRLAHAGFKVKETHRDVKR